MHTRHSPETGEELVILTHTKYNDLIDGARHEATMRDIADASADGNTETLTDAEAGDYPAAPTPIAFWRKRLGLTQQQLAGAVGISQPDITLLEYGRREAMGSVYARLARALRVRADDLLPGPPAWPERSATPG